jgi:hypothetical protein
VKSLDAFLSSYDFATRHAVTVEADPAQADRALREVTFGEVAPLVRGLLFVRGLGVPREADRVLDTMVPRATVLEDVPGEGIVLSLTGQFWRIRGRGPEPPARAVIAFRSVPGALTTETRIQVSDPVSRRKFVRYWRVVRPFSGIIRVLVLRAAKRRAERAS